MTSPSDKRLREQLNAPVVPERDEDFALDLLDRVRRDRRRVSTVAFVWVAVLVALAGLVAAGLFIGGGEAIRLALGA